ncbi:putative GTP-binding protein [Papiliotrema laurentii]|uniref:GTP-binding protein n=1 Tax=Papiliotrema laurentii TaxID=5418 RepID=A0AAD9FVH8_PAPLA|nr:putative GTP-binding protein [Papiliotrema laurentii]
MPRIRKKTSRRQNTRDRAKITKKVSEHKRKTKKEAKKDVTWKSKKKADPGVPNTFPYKDRVLAELAEEKRRNEEAKQARRDAQKHKQEEEEADTPGIISLATAVLKASAPAAVAAAPEEEEVDVPELVDTALATLQDVLDKADVVLQVVDARDVLGGRSGYVEKMVVDAGGVFGLIVNKIDLVPREALQGWLPHLPKHTYLFASDPSSSAAGPARQALLSALSSFAIGSDKTVALVGLPNVGKTSVLNALLPLSAKKHDVAPAVPTAASAKNPNPTTVKPTEVRLDLGEGKKIGIIDTPGWEFAEDEEEEEEEGDEEDWDALEDRVAGDMLRRNLGRVDRVKDVFPLVNWILKRSSDQDLMLAYNVPYFQPGDIQTFLLSVARANGRVKKHGDVDVDSAARIVVRDWAHNAFPYYSAPPAGSKGDVEAWREVLDACRTRKEMRASGRGIIKFQGGEIDQREVILDDDYIAMAEGGEEDDDEDEEEEDEDEEDDDEDEEEDDEDEEDEDEEDDASDDADALLISAEDGEELDLEDGPEPSSGSDLAEEDEEEEDEVEEEEEVEEREPTPPTTKRKRKSDVVPVATAKKAKRVSFGKNEIRVMEDERKRGKGKRKRS